MISTNMTIKSQRCTITGAFFSVTIISDKSALFSIFSSTPDKGEL